MEEQVYLTGASHFAFGFIFGSIVMVVFFKLKRSSLWVQLYMPFLPFLLGLIAAIPYIFLEPANCVVPAFYNVFFFYSALHCDYLADIVLGSLHLVTILCGLIYCFILLRYILLVKYIRRHGWNKGAK